MEHADPQLFPSRHLPPPISVTGEKDQDSLKQIFTAINMNGPGTYDVLVRSGAKCEQSRDCPVTIQVSRKEIKVLAAVSTASRTGSAQGTNRPPDDQVSKVQPARATTGALRIQYPSMSIGTWYFPNGSNTTVVVSMRVRILTVDGNGHGRPVTGLTQQSIQPQRDHHAPAFLGEFELPTGNYAVEATLLPTGITSTGAFVLLPRSVDSTILMSSLLLSPGCSTTPIEQTARRNLMNPLNGDSCEWIPLNPRSLSVAQTLTARVLFSPGDAGAREFPKGWTSSFEMRRRDELVVGSKPSQILKGKIRGWEVSREFPLKEDGIPTGEYEVVFSLNGPGKQHLTRSERFTVDGGR
jgi:hypothetical protein